MSPVVDGFSVADRLELSSVFTKLDRERPGGQLFTLTLPFPFFKTISSDLTLVYNEGVRQEHLTATHLIATHYTATHYTPHRYTPHRYTQFTQEVSTYDSVLRNLSGHGQARNVRCYYGGRINSDPAGVRLRMACNKRDLGDNKNVTVSGPVVSCSRSSCR